MLWLLIKKYIRQITQIGIPGPQATFSAKVTPDIDGFSDEPVHYDVRDVKNTFPDDSK